ncbi:MAG: 3'-5' exonuclease [Bacteroidota bacterium]|nr:3'-5' exonuclease [Bacteroidota bacterium]
MSFINQLNSVQQNAAKQVEGPVMIVAGAGSGKTRVLTYRVAYLLSIGVPPYQLLVLTFTNKAADEMKKRIVSLVGDKSGSAWIGTFHSMFARLLRYESEHIGYGKNFSIYDTDDSLGLIKNIQHDLEISAQAFKPNAIRARISSAKNKLVSPDQFEILAKDIFEEKTALIFKEYQKRLKQNNAMDFDDLLLKPIELFERHSKILSKYQDRFKFVLVDEYQDTNRAQYKLIKMVAGKYKNICIVGDDAQSIYGFRGADIRNILDFEKDFPEAKIFHLEQNYRSTQTILTAADQVIKNNVNRIEKTLWTDNPKGEPISVLSCQSDTDESEKVAANIKKAILKYKIDFLNIAILYRTNAQSRSIEDALRRSGIPYLIIGGIEFYKRKEIKDIIAYLRLIVNPKDDISFQRIVNYPARGIGDVTVNHLKAVAEECKCSFFEAVDFSTEAKGISKNTIEKLKQFRKLIQKFIGLKTILSASELSRSLVDDIGILKEFKEEGTVETLSRMENVHELLSAITEFSEKNINGGLEAFLQEVSLVADVDRLDDKRNAVTLMTVHSAKGLEYDVVFIMGLEEGLFPIFQAIQSTNEVEEERRLFYVGMTRCMRKLYLSYAYSRYRMGELTYPNPSRFMKEIKDDLYIYENGPLRKESGFNKELDFFDRPTKSQVPFKRPKNYSEKKIVVQHFRNYESQSQVAEELHVGSVVRHSTFGKGRILQLNGNGDETRAVIDFENAGRKQLMLKYAALEVL